MEEPPVRLLSIDGGGVRGLSALVLLQQLMEHVNIQREHQGLEPQEPWELFDLMGGTSTGGLIAILLGRLRMPLDEAIDAYIRLSGRAFTKQNILFRTGHKVTLGAKFKTGPLEDAIQEMIGDGWATKLLKEENSEGDKTCKVFVMSHLQNLNTAVVLRSYRNTKSPKATYGTMLMWQAARATSAALTYFDPITVDHQTYSDGGLYYNNPISRVHAEANEVFGDRKQIIVSLGTGAVITKEWDPNLLTIAEGLAKIATETLNAANDFYRLARGKIHYFRFNVPELGEKDLAESDPKSLANIKAMTEEYLTDPKVGDEVESCAGILAVAKQQLVGVQIDEATRSSILHWLSELNFWDIHDQHVAEREEGTGEISSRLEPDFSYWFNGDHDYVWLRGDPGTGKSTLMSSLFEILHSRSNIAIACLYLEKALGTVSTRDLLACILRQLTEHSGHLARATYESYERHRLRKTQVRKFELLEMLVEQARGFEHIYIFVDALDRMDRKLVFELLDALDNFQQRAENVCIMVSSPEISDYRQRLNRAREHEVCADEKEMALFVHHHIERSAPSMVHTMTREDKGLESQIQATVREKAGGMFIMAKLLMELLASPNHESKNSFRNGLANLPDAPDEAYRQLWARIIHQNESDASLACRIFSWVTFSEQPLTIKDLQYALHLGTNPQSWPFDPDDLILEKKLGSVCLGVIAVKPKTSVIAFVHHTAELFFPRFFASDFALQSQRTIATSCMHYMKLLGGLRNTSVSGSYPLQAYSGFHWATHVARANSSIMLDDVVNFLYDDDGLRGAAFLLLSTLSKRNNHKTRIPVVENVTSLHIAAYFGLVDVAKRLLCRDRATVDQSTDSYWTALRWATINQQFEMVQCLVKQGAEIDLADDEGNNVFMWALGRDQDLSRLGDLNIWNCSIHIGETYYYRSLEEVAQPLDVVTSEPRTSLEILDFLAKNTKSIHTQNKAGLSTLAIAAKHRHLGLVRYLLGRGADINSTNTSGMTPLLWALQPEPRRELFLENINVWGDACVHVGPHIIVNPSLPVHHDSQDVGIDYLSYETTLLMLVGDNLDAKDSHGRTALSLAAGKGLIRLVTKLLKDGADVTAADEDEMTAYDWALLPPVAHRTFTKNVNVWGSATVLMGIQYECHELDSHSSRALPKAEVPHNLLAGILLEQLRLRGHEPSSTWDTYPPRKGLGMTVLPDHIHATGDSSITLDSGSFALFSHKNQGTRSIGWCSSYWQLDLPTQSRYTAINTWGSSRTVFGIAAKLHFTEPLTDGSPETWLTAFASEQLRARNILVHNFGGKTNVWGMELATDGDSQSEAEQHAGPRHKFLTDDKAKAEWLKWHRLLEEKSYRLEKLEGENYQILSSWKADGYMWVLP